MSSMIGTIFNFLLGEGVYVYIYFKKLKLIQLYPCVRLRCGSRLRATESVVMLENPRVKFLFRESEGFVIGDDSAI